jgi:cytochrome c oxidase assembly factor CtaG
MLVKAVAASSDTDRLTYGTKNWDRVVILTTSRGLLALALSPVVILLASAARLLIIANYDTTTATTMAASGGLGQTILGTVIPLLPSFLPALLVVLVILRQWALFGFAALAAALISPAYAT